VTVPQGSGGLPERAWADGEADEPDHPAADLTGGMGLVSVAFLGAALRRRSRLWSVAGVAGLLFGAGVYVISPPAYQASTSVLIAHDPAETPTDAMQTDALMAQSRTVAEVALRDLGLREDPLEFLGSYTVTAATDRVLAITVSAPSGSEAVHRASVLASVFLKFRADQLLSAQRLVTAALNRQIASDKRQVNELTSQISALPATPTAPSKQAELSSLTAQRTQVQNTLTGLQSTVSAYPLTTVSQIAGSKVLDAAAPLPHSHLRVAATYALLGLVAGLALGMGTVVVGALVSDRLRRRDDIARVLGAPVTLSTGRIEPWRLRPGRCGPRLLAPSRLGRLLPRRPRRAGAGPAGARGRDIQRIAAHLRGAVPETSRGTAALAVVAVDNEHTAALPVVTLALSCAREGKDVVLADLAARAPAARLLGVRKSGISTVSRDGAGLRVVVPARGEITPTGPLRRGGTHSQPGLAADQAGTGTAPETGLAAACASAGLLLTLVTLDPAAGAEHLAGWAASAVVVVTAGRSSSTRINAVGELVRLAGLPLAGVVLTGADTTDESLGITCEQAQWVRRGPGPGAVTR
jgi:capsular polysaccharide biosynthesis protein